MPRGGFRPGAGRPLSESTATWIGVRLTDAELAHLATIDESTSAAIHEVIERDIKRGKKTK